jgi:hypothetical protein
MIVKVGAIVTAVLILSGALTALVGGLMIFKGALMLVGSSMSAAVGKAALLTAALVLVTDGIVKLTQGASTGERALGGLELAAAGAAAGFAVGGPLGAAIGGVAGLFGALVIDSQRAQTSVEEAAAAANASMTDWEGLAGTLDQTTGAMTELTRSYIAQNLVETGTSDALASYGIDLRTATLAVEGNKAAIAKVNDALKINQVEVRNARNEWKQKQSAVDDATAAVQNSRDAHARVSQSLYDEAEAAKKTYLQQRNNRDAIKASIGALKSSQKQIRDNASELGHWGKALKELPKEKRTQIKLENIPKSKQEIAELINKFDIARKDIKPLMKAAGFETTKKNVEDVIKKAKALNDSDPTVKIDGDAKRALGVLSSLRTVVDNLTGKTYYIRVVTVHSTQGGGGAGGGGGGGGGKDIQNEWERSLLRRATVEVAGVGRFIAQAMAAFPEQISGPASSAMEEAFSTIDQFIENHTNQQLRKAKRAYEQRYKEQREALKRGWDGSKKDLAKKLAEMEREHDKHVTQLEKRYAKMIKNRIKGLADEKKAVREAAEAYDTTAAALDEWNRKLEDHIRTVHDSFVEYGNVTQLGKSMDIWGQEQAVTWQSIVSDLGQRVLEAQRFQELLVTLAEAGLNPTTLQQIVNAGVEGGLAYAEAIASGGSEAVNQINTLAQQMADAGTAAGVETGVSIYGSTIISLMEQLEKDKGQLIKAMQRLGRRAGRAIKEGVVAQAGPINTAIGDLAEQWEETLRRKWGLPITGTVPRNATAPTAPSATTTNNYQYVTVYTQEIDPAANAVSLSWELANRTG